MSDINENNQGEQQQDSQQNQQSNQQSSQQTYAPQPTPQYINTQYNQGNEQFNDIYMEPAKGMAVASLVLGIISFFCFAFVTGVLAIIFGAVAKNKGNKTGKATAGIICGILGIILWVITIIFLPDMMNEMLDRFTNLSIF